MKTENERLALDLEDVVLLLRRKGHGSEAHAVADAIKHLRGCVTPGWTCDACGTFTGDIREYHAACRACGAERPHRKCW